MYHSPHLIDRWGLFDAYKMMMDPTEDSVIFYTFRTTKYTSREEIGLKKGGDENIL